MKRFWPTKFFYKKFLKIALPIIAQQIFINSAIIIDNLMVGRLGKEAIMAIGAANAINILFMFALFGMARGAGIYVAQYNGAKNKEMLLKAAGIKQQLMLLNGILSVVIVWLFAPQLIGRFIAPIPENALITKTAITYLKIWIFSQIFKSMNFGMSTTFQQLGLPYHGLKASAISVVVNIILNYFLIFGIGPFPQLGVTGAAIGTVVCKFVSWAIWVWGLDTSKLHKNYFALYFQGSKELFIKIIKKTIPLLASEVLWSIAMVVKFSMFSSYGSLELTAMSIQQNINNFVTVIWAGVSGATVYLIGKKLGSGELKHAKERAFHLIGVTFKIGILITIFLFVISKPILSIYSIDGKVYDQTLRLIRLTALWYPLWLVIGAMFFTIRTGGQVQQTTTIDIVSAWLFLLPMFWIGKHVLKLGSINALMFATASDLFKLVMTIYFFRKYDWLKSLVKKTTI